MSERLAAFGTELIEIHRWLRRDLAGLRSDVERHLGGRGRPPELKAQCLGFCSVLGKHHTGEDVGAFPLLAKEFPELRPVIAQLEEDHRQIAGMLRQLDRVVVGIAADQGSIEADRVLGELDGLAAILESHFTFEERKIVGALNSLAPDERSTVGLFGVDTRGED